MGFIVAFFIDPPQPAPPPLYEVKPAWLSLTLAPFAAHSTDAKMFAAGLSEELLDRMGRMQGIAVFAQRTPIDGTAWKQRLVLEGG